MFALLIQDPQQAPKYAPDAGADALGQLSPLASSFHEVDGLFYFTYAVCAFFFILIAGALLYTVIAHRRKTFDQPPASNVTHNTPLEVVWTIIPLIIVMVMFGWGYMGARDMTTAPAGARRYQVEAKQWSWTFHHPNDPVASFNEVWLEVGKPAEFLMKSTDVLHSFYIPAFRIKRDVVPGVYQTAWALPEKVGTYHLFCAEYCGKDHSQMYAKVHVVTAEEYAKRPWDDWKDSTPEEAAASGKSLYNRLCASCHSTDGSPLTGPSWKGMFTKNADGTFTGRQSEVVEAGERKTITVDHDYIAESIAKPEQKKVVGFENANMTAFQLDERRVNGLIEFMKTLADQ